ncbi:MAG TPA: hypothetical protein VMM35_08470, partial [Longimicrobiales bacterium]|nr:hypothetical protein [Longimicrobiales bacterium]
MNTVGKPGKLGEHVKCVVSVSMLTEGWDVNTVTHVLGVLSAAAACLILLPPKHVVESSAVASMRGIHAVACTGGYRVFRYSTRSP